MARGAYGYGWDCDVCGAEYGYWTHAGASDELDRIAESHRTRHHNERVLAEEKRRNNLLEERNRIEREKLAISVKP